MELFKDINNDIKFLIKKFSSINKIKANSVYNMMKKLMTANRTSCWFSFRDCREKYEIQSFGRSKCRPTSNQFQWSELAQCQNATQCTEQYYTTNYKVASFPIKTIEDISFFNFNIKSMQRLKLPRNTEILNELV